MMKLKKVIANLIKKRKEQKMDNLRMEKLKKKQNLIILKRICKFNFQNKDLLITLRKVKFNFRKYKEIKLHNLGCAV